MLDFRLFPKSVNGGPVGAIYMVNRSFPVASTTRAARPAAPCSDTEKIAIPLRSTTTKGRSHDVVRYAVTQKSGSQFGSAG